MHHPDEDDAAIIEHVFDKEARAFLGMTDYTAVVEQAIVDQAGQLP